MTAKPRRRLLFWIVNGLFVAAGIAYSAWRFSLSGRPEAAWVGAIVGIGIAFVVLRYKGPFRP